MLSSIKYYPIIILHKILSSEVFNKKKLSKNGTTEKF